MGRIRNFFRRVGGIFRRKPKVSVRRTPISETRFRSAELTGPIGVNGLARE